MNWFRTEFPQLQQAFLWNIWRTGSLTLIYEMLRMAPNVAKTRAAQITKEACMDTPEYKEYLANKLKMAQIDYQSKLDIAAIDAKNVELKKKFQWR